MGSSGTAARGWRALSHLVEEVDLAAGADLFFFVSSEQTVFEQLVVLKPIHLHVVAGSVYHRLRRHQPDNLGVVNAHAITLRLPADKLSHLRHWRAVEVGEVHRDLRQPFHQNAHSLDEMEAA